MADFVCLLASFLLFNQPLLSLAQGGPEPLQIPASRRLYGPDGPWQAVSVRLGSPGQGLDLYPGGIYQSDILTRQICQDPPTLPCGSGGLFAPESSDTLDDYSISFGSGASGTGSQWTNGATLFSYGDLTSIRDQLQIAGRTVANFSAIMYPNITMIYPDGEYPLQVGELALGPVFNQTFSEQDGIPSINASLIPGELAAQNVIPSNSFGLHVGIGAATLRLSLSLWLGGYDASRIVGPVSSQSTHDYLFAIDLLDIGIDVDHGGSPLSPLPQQGLLSQANSSISIVGIPVTLNPSAPYLYLPSSTCAAIAKYLPVTYNAGKALYFWNIADPQYTNIVTSPTYLSFLFRGSSGNLTIKAPFHLLNLTLEQPLVSTDTPYFPCQPPQGPEGQYSLGRAFLQAAFIGVNWARTGESEWYLAQAPGPNTNTDSQSKPFTGSPPVGLAKDWADTWSGFWTALPSSTVIPTIASATASATPGFSAGSSSSAMTPPGPSRHSLSIGAIIGIALGSFSVALVAFTIVVKLLQRKHRNRRNAEAMQLSTIDKADADGSSYPLYPQHQETGREMVCSEIGSGSRTEKAIHEQSLDDHHGVELPGT